MIHFCANFDWFYLNGVSIKKLRRERENKKKVPLHQLNFERKDIVWKKSITRAKEDFWGAMGKFSQQNFKIELKLESTSKNDSI